MEEIFIYNQVTRALGCVDLIKLTTLEKFALDKTIYGPYVRSLLFHHNGINRSEAKIGDNLFEACYDFDGLDPNPIIIKKFSYLPLRRLQDINNEKDNYKFIMNEKGEIFTTITGLIFAIWEFELEQITYKLDSFKIHNAQYLEEIRYNKITLPNTDLLRGKIRLIFFIKLKYRLSKVITYIILKEYAFKNLFYIQSMCERCENYYFTDDCAFCYKCPHCMKIYDEINICGDCDAKIGCHFCDEIHHC